MIFYILTYSLNILALIASITMVYAKSPVRSVFSSILAFALVTAVFLNLNVQFATLVLLLVYLGAVIVMFLILVMFINIRVYKTSNIEVFSLQFCSFIIAISLFSIILYSNMNEEFFFYYLKWFSFYDNMEILPTMCFQLFSLFSIEIFLIVFLLLISMISSMAIVFLELQNLWKISIEKVKF